MTKDKAFNDEPLMVRELACECGAKWNFENKTLNFTPSLKRVQDAKKDKALRMALDFLENIEHPDCTDEIMAIKEALQEKTAPKG